MFKQPDFNDRSQYGLKRFTGVLLLILVLTTVGYASFRLGNKTNEIEVQNNLSLWRKTFNVLTFNAFELIDKDYIMPSPEENRLDILILGIRGENDPEAKEGGALLTDTIMVFSFDKLTKKASLVSIPRDLYVKITRDKKDKINSTYEYGVYHHYGLNYIEELVSKITGIYIDKTLVINFSSFEKIIDDIGGIDIHLERPFQEPKQWSYIFNLPAGDNHLNGRDALYYTRSRYSSSDFDRSRRQQEVVFAIKNKLQNLDFWKDPIKTVGILNSIRGGIDTDISIWDYKNLLGLAKEINGAEKFKKYTISTDNLVYESKTSSGSYILLPKEDRFDQIKQLFRDIIK